MKKRKPERTGGIRPKDNNAHLTKFPPIHSKRSLFPTHRCYRKPSAPKSRLLRRFRRQFHLPNKLWLLGPKVGCWFGAKDYPALTHCRSTREVTMSAESG